MKSERLEIVWHDSQSQGVWQSIESARAANKLEEHHTLGYFVAEDDDAITVAQNITYDGGKEVLVADIITIPKAVVLSIHRVRRSEKRKA